MEILEQKFGVNSAGVWGGGLRDKRGVGCRVLGVRWWVVGGAGGWWVVGGAGGCGWWMVDGAWMILANMSVVQNGGDGGSDDGAHSPDLHAPTSLFDARMAFLSGSESTVCARPAVAVVVVVGGSHEDSFVFLL